MTHAEDRLYDECHGYDLDGNRLSSSIGWTYDARHFVKTYSERGGLRHFINGRPTRREVWLEELRAAKNISAPDEEAPLAEAER